MAGRDGNGVFTVTNPDFVSGTVISSSEMDANFADVATAITQSIAVDGQTTVTANLPMNSKHFTGMDVGTLAGDSLTLGQAQAGAFRRTTLGGSKNALTLTPAPAITAYAAGQRFTAVIGGTSSDDAVTVDVSGLGTKDVEIDNAALSASVVLTTAKTYDFEYDGTAFQATRLSTIASGGDVVGPASATDSALAQFDGTTGKLLKDGPSVGVATTNLPTVNQASTNTASATSTTLGTTLKHIITGTTTITSFAGVAGVTYKCTAGGAFLLTFNGTNLDILQTGANITTVADDTFDVYMRTTTTAEIRNYQRASGSPLTSSGGWQFVSASTASASATISFTGFEAGFDYMLTGTAVDPVSDGVAFNVLLGITGPTYRTSGYKGVATGVSSAGGSIGTALSTSIKPSPITQGNATDEEMVFELTLFDPVAATDTYYLGHSSAHQTTTVFYSGDVGGHHGTAESMTAIQCSYASGNISAGYFKLYKRANA